MTEEALKRFQALLGQDQILSDPSECWPYGYDNSRRHAPPSCVLFPRSHEDVVSIIKTCNEYKLAVTARGRGTGTTGGAVPLHQAVVLSFERMNRILSVDPDNRVIVVEPGVTNQEVQNAAAACGFFWPPDPTSAAYCTIGGNIAFNSAGPRAVKYGTPRENVLDLVAVTGDGKTIRTGVYTSKGVVGYDLTRLLIGSEGTLAIITEATLKLTPLSQTKRTMQALFTSMSHAAQAVSRIMGQADTPYALEFIDAGAIRLIKEYANIPLPANTAAMLMIEVDGSEHSLEESINNIRAATQGEGLIELSVANDKASVDRIWRARKALSPTLRKIAPKKINEDVVVPVSHMADLIDGLSALSERYGITIVNFGHAGNGNIHVNLLIDPDDPIQSANAKTCLDEVFALVLSLKGTLSGEHGVGIEKRDFIDREISATSLELMRAIKRTFDPNNILNPDKVFPLRD